ncbi:MAG: redox-regulated ATPase YchF [Parcubacteria group bacterium RIFCSPLOWO2_01_FULL_48_18]|nr:MAG: redox-regulated ATPase YchF [Parcubacteria group bacterium RIFCSPLOWO2_01_FULL_48_18]OHB23000.1 MAG: redox-regulated ATPase YchF [Parcubacteria group bacterium RIFCSPHIGHO2_02_FULL_48_10b]
MSKLSIGIVGLPNVGKSTLFQAITKKQVDRANYPFCTIDPNVGVVAVPDERVDVLAQLTHSAKKVCTTIEFLDIAGLVKGASQGEGLGNKFLANIREADAIVYVLRAFSDPNIVNTQSSIDPSRDKEILDMELILKDVETVSKRIEGLGKDIKGGKKEAVRERDILSHALQLLEKGEVLFEKGLVEEERRVLNGYQLLTMKPRIYLLNGREKEIPQSTSREFQTRGWPYISMDVQEEFEAAGLTVEERVAFGLSRESRLDRLIKTAYDILHLITFLTTGEDETRAWTLCEGSTAVAAAGTIHSDFAKHFIKAEVINWKTLMDAGGFSQARERGLIRTEGKEYAVRDGDVIEIKHAA